LFLLSRRKGFHSARIKCIFSVRWESGWILANLSDWGSFVDGSGVAAGIAANLDEVSEPAAIAGWRLEDERNETRMTAIEQLKQQAIPCFQLVSKVPNVLLLRERFSRT
jgi:hypothetical protein